MRLLYAGFDESELSALYSSQRHRAKRTILRDRDQQIKIFTNRIERGEAVLAAALYFTSWGVPGAQPGKFTQT
jgi:hypothetical protein